MSQRPIHEMEKKWQDAWEREGVYHATRILPDQQAGTHRASQKKYYGLIEFPYPSGEGLHVGHARSFVAIDVITRKKRMEGYDVLYPIGWDAFGLPTENYAIKHQVKPQDATKKNIANSRRQLMAQGIGFDWSREINTTDPAYYKWTQWQFLQFFKHGLAYKASSTINWCPKDKIGLANEEAQGGVCERCGTVVEKREKKQWMIAITKYAERLLKDLEDVDYPDRVKSQQIHWIGRSDGATIVFKTKSDHGELADIRVFTTRPDTLFGATYVVMAPEHEWIAKQASWIMNRQEAQTYVEAARNKSEMERSSGEREKTGVRLEGVTAINPANGREIPIWVADYVLAGYGTGAIMAVPAHDERDFAFAQKYGLPVEMVVCPHYPTKTCPVLTQAFTGDGHNVASDFLDGLPTWKAKQDIISWLEERGLGVRAVTYKLRDWVFSRQRYWGEPIPIVHCAKCGEVPVPEDQLPVLLPDVDAYEPTETGESPLAKIREWVEVACPSCGGRAERETDTMPNWAGSSWYFLRYCDPHNNTAFVGSEPLKYWMPVDLYNGGMEHTTLHLLYSRFWHKFLWDIGAIPKECGPEPYTKRRSHGLILAQGGEKMSKSKGNVVNPDDIIAQYGADVFRLYMMFMGPYDQPVPWDTNGIEGVKRFLDRVWTLCEVPSSEFRVPSSLETLYHQTIKKISEGIDQFQFNTCVSQLMILANAYQDVGGIPEEHREGLMKLLAPFAPHLAEELCSMGGRTSSIHRSSWPVYDESKLGSTTFELVIQVNGKVRDRMTVASDISEEEAKMSALSAARVRTCLSGQEPKKIIYVAGKLINIVT